MPIMYFRRQELLITSIQVVLTLMRQIFWQLDLKKGAIFITKSSVFLLNQYAHFQIVFAVSNSIFQEKYCIQGTQMEG